MRIFMYLIFSVVAVFVIVGALGGGDKKDDNKVVLSTPKVCKKVANFYLDPEVILNEGSRDLGVKVVAAEAVKSDDFENFYFVQYKMETPSNGTIYPMFAMNKPFGMGVIYAMDELAITVSGLGDGRKTKTKFKSTDDGFSEASRCLK